MKITENEVEVAKHQSVIVPIVFVFLLFVCGNGVRVVILSSAPPVLLRRRRYALKLRGCCFRLQKMQPLLCEQSGGRMIGRRLTSSDKSEKQKMERSCRSKREQTFIMPSQLVVNVACSVVGAAADMALRYTCIEMAIL